MTTSEIGTRSSSAAIPAAGTSTTRISWVANAVEAIASVPNTANATRLVSRCSPSLRDESGDPMRMRLTSEYTGHISARVQAVPAVQDSTNHEVHRAQ